MLLLYQRKLKFIFKFPQKPMKAFYSKDGGTPMDTTDALQKNILDATLRVFDRKGLKFTMDDLAKELSISKKTIYTVYDDKEALFLAMVDYIFDSIKESEQMILTDPALGTIEKLQRILGVLPEGYQNIDLRKLYSLRDKYPKIYHKVELRLETGWEPTIQLIETGMAEGSIRPVPICLGKKSAGKRHRGLHPRCILSGAVVWWNRGGRTADPIQRKRAYCARYRKRTTKYNAMSERCKRWDSFRNTNWKQRKPADRLIRK